MSFQVTVRDSRGRAVGMTGLEKYFIENEDYYQQTRVINQRIRQELEREKPKYTGRKQV